MKRKPPVVYPRLMDPDTASRVPSWIRLRAIGVASTVCLMMACTSLATAQSVAGWGAPSDQTTRSRVAVAAFQPDHQMPSVEPTTVATMPEMVGGECLECEEGVPCEPCPSVPCDSYGLGCERHPPSCAPALAACCDGGYGPYGGCACCGGGGCGCCCPTWAVSVTGLVMGRDEPNNRVWGVGPVYTDAHDEYFNTVADDAADDMGLGRHNCWDYGPVLTTSDAGIEWGGGVDIRVLRCLNCCWGVEAAYWAVWDISADARHVDKYNHKMRDNLYTPFDMTNIDFYDDEDCWPASWAMQEVDEYRLERDNEFDNVEINFVRNVIGGTCGGLPACCDPCNPWRVDGVFGIHWFRFEETLRFSAIDYEFRPTYWKPGNMCHSTSFIQDEVENNLVGVHVGARLRRCIGPHFEIAASPMIGIYGNHMNHGFSMGNHYGMNAGVYSYNDCEYKDYPVSSSEDDVAFIGTCDIQARMNVTCNCTAFIGYRVLFATGIALADNQIPNDWAFQSALREIDNNGEILLHGAMAGLELRY